MNIPNNKADARRLDPLVVAGDADEAASSIILPSVAEASAVSRPGNVDRLWVEDEFDELEAEQGPLWEASGEDASRAPQITAASEEMAADAAATLLTVHQQIVDAMLQRYLDTMAALASFRRRAVGTKRWYQLGKVGVFVGDLAGFAAAAIWLGEEVGIALLLALSAATATIAAGLIGTEFRDIRSRKGRARPVADLPASLVPFAHLFAQEDDGELYVWQVVKISFVTAAMIGLGIGTLRAVVDDPLVGLVFGGVALAVAGGSLLLSYASADQISDVIDLAQADYLKADAEHRKMAGDPIWRARAGAQAEADSLQAEHGHRGRAAQDHVRAQKHRVLRMNPHVAGHGGPAPSVGRTTRREEAQR